VSPRAYPDVTVSVADLFIEEPRLQMWKRRGNSTLIDLSHYSGLRSHVHLHTPASATAAYRLQCPTLGPIERELIARDPLNVKCLGYKQSNVNHEALTK